jgi:prepilin-type N-terminal cleavage/methylation domain-containing protein
MKRRTGLTLIELAIAVVIVGVAASVAVPAAMNRSILANEASAIVALRDIATAQERFKAAKYVDVNGDGVGEYGLFRELSGAVGVRTNADAATVGGKLDSPLLPPGFRRFNRNSEVRRAGYLFNMFLPSVVGIGTPEVSVGPLAGALDSKLAATYWCCYARPQKRGVTGDRTFFINQTGDIVSTDAHGWEAKYGFVASNAGAAFASGGNLVEISGAVAVGTVGRDGNLWQAVARAAVERDLVARGPMRDEYDAVRGTFAISSHESPVGTRETLIVRVDGLAPRGRYLLIVDHPISNLPAFEAVLRSDAHGRATFHLNNRTRSYSEGVSSLTDLVGGLIEIGDERETTYITARIPAFETVGPDATPAFERIAADEAVAIAALQEIAAAQTQFQAMKAVDFDVDGVGEFGLLRELTGFVGLRTASTAATVGNRLDPPLLPSSFTGYASDTEVARSGYLFHLFLPGFAGTGVSDISSGSLAAPIYSDLAATAWCCYASPRQYGKTGARTFFVNQTGDVVATDATYSRTGAFTASNAGAAFQSGWAPTNITGIVATGTVGRDGNVWRAVPSRPDEHDFVVRGALTPTSPGAATGTFVVESRQLTNATDETIDVDATGLDASTEYRVVLVDTSNAEHAFGATTSDARGGVAFRFDGRFHALPDGVASVTSFGGGTIELRDGDTPVLRGAIPVFATIGGPTIADSSVVFHVKRPLDALPKSLPRSGSLDVRVTNADGDRREQLVVEITTFDRGATYDVVAVDAQDVATPLGAIDVAGLRGVGTLSLDTRRGDVVPGGGLAALFGARIEVRSSTGAVVLAETMPVVE